MIKLLAVCAALAATVAVPAQAETAITLKLSGKAPAVIRKEVYTAASQVCWKDAPSEYSACVEDTVDYTLSQIRSRHDI